MQIEHPLVGSWRLESFELQMKDGQTIHPYGRELAGYLFYNGDGFMSAAFMNAARGRVEGNDLEAAAKTSSYDQFMAYTGGYEVTGDRIRHFVEVASLEVWNHTVQERWYKIDGDRLELLTQPLTVGSDAPVGRLVWQRVSRSASAA
jgi:Lipocalin-like domain